MRILELSSEDYAKRIQTPFNPPDANVSDVDFEKEYLLLFDKLEAILSEFGENNSYGQGDYCLEPAITRSRGLGFQVSKNEFVTESLLNRLQHLLLSFAPNWEIFIGSHNYDYGIFIGSTAIRFHRDNAQLLSQLTVPS